MDDDGSTPFDMLQQIFRRELGSTSSGSPVSLPPSFDRPTPIDDHVFEVAKPDGKPSIELLFFHGLQLMDSDEPYLTTWLSASNTECWLNWLLQDFPKARILTITYDAYTKRTARKGRMDMRVIAENLVQSLTSNAEVGQSDCPVVLVGHCIGGLVMKEVCLEAHKKMSSRDGFRVDNRLQNFLGNVKGFFFFATPHHGSVLVDNSANREQGPLFKAIKTLNKITSRQNEEFRDLRKGRYTWKTRAVGETIGVNLGELRGVFAPEGSTRCDVDSFNTVSADHFNICKPASTKTSSFQFLKDFIGGLLEESAAKLGRFTNASPGKDMYLWEEMTMRTTDVRYELRAYKNLSRKVQDVGKFLLEPRGRSPCPKFIYPGKRDSGAWMSLKDALSLSESVHLHFLCEAQYKDYTQHEVKCQPGIDVSNLKDWRQTILPWLRASLTVLFASGKAAANEMAPDGGSSVPDFIKWRQASSLADGIALATGYSKGELHAQGILPTDNSRVRCHREPYRDFQTRIGNAMTEVWGTPWPTPQQILEKSGLQKVSLKLENEDENRDVWICGECRKKFSEAQSLS